MANEELIALLERRFDELQFLLLQPKKQLEWMERGDSPMDDRLKRLTAEIVELEKRLDQVEPGPPTRMLAQSAREQLKKLERAHYALEARVAAIENSRGSTSGREPSGSETPR